MDTLVLPRPRHIPSVCIAQAFRQVVRLGASWSVLFPCLCLHTHHSSLRLLLFGVCPRCPLVLTWMNLSACGCLLAPLSGITLTTRAIRSQDYTLFNSYRLVRPPRPLCKCRHPHETHMVQRLQVLCPAHRSHSVPPVHRFRWGPPALSQVTFCQLRSLRLPRSSPLPHSWSVASLLMLHHPPATHPHPTSGCRHADFSTHRCLSGRFYATLVQGVLGSTFYARCSLPHVFPTRPLVTS